MVLGTTTAAVGQVKVTLAGTSSSGTAVSQALLHRKRKLPVLEFGSRKLHSDSSCFAIPERCWTNGYRQLSSD